MFFSAVLCAPDIVDGIHAERLFWSANINCKGLFEKKVKGRWLQVGARLQAEGKDPSGYLDKKYVKTFRVNKALFDALYADTRDLLEKQDTSLCAAVSAEKRLAILLYWLAHSNTQNELADVFNVGQSTIHNIVHSGVNALVGHLAKKAIKFPQGAELERVMKDFKRLCKLPMCAGAIDGTFMKIIKPSIWGDSFWCYKSHPAIIILAVVDSDGIFTFVDAGRAGSLGDAYTFNHSRLLKKIEDNVWLPGPSKTVFGQQIKPYILADSAFGSSEYIIKGYKHPPPPGRPTSFNASVNQGRKVVEQTFGRLKGRFRIVKTNFIRDPEFAAKVAMLCCSLHNLCTRGNVPFFDSWLPDPEDYLTDPDLTDDNPVAGAAVATSEAIQLALAKYAHRWRR